MISQFKYFLLASILNFAICLVLTIILEFNVSIPIIMFFIIFLSVPALIVTTIFYVIIRTYLKILEKDLIFTKYIIYFLIYMCISTNFVAYESYLAPLYFMGGLQYHTIHNDFIKLQDAQKEYYMKNKHFASTFKELSWKKWEMSRCNYFMGNDKVISDIIIGNEKLQIPVNNPDYLDSFSRDDDYRIIALCKWNFQGYYDIWAISPKYINQISAQWSHKFSPRNNKPVYYFLILPFKNKYE